MSPARPDKVAPAVPETRRTSTRIQRAMASAQYSNDGDSSPLSSRKKAQLENSMVNDANGLKIYSGVQPDFSRNTELVLSPVANNDGHVLMVR